MNPAHLKNVILAYLLNVKECEIQLLMVRQKIDFVTVSRSECNNYSIVIATFLSRLANAALTNTYDSVG